MEVHEWPQNGILRTQRGRVGFCGLQHSIASTTGHRKPHLFTPVSINTIQFFIWALRLSHHLGDKYPIDNKSDIFILPMSHFYLNLFSLGHGISQLPQRCQLWFLQSHLYPIFPPPKTDSLFLSLWVKSSFCKCFQCFLGVQCLLTVFPSLHHKQSLASWLVCTSL